MLDPMLFHKLTHVRQPAELVAQLTQLDPELALPAALPLLAARLLGAQDVEEEDEPDEAHEESA